MRVLFVVDKVSGGAGNVIQLLAMSFRDHGEEAGILFTDGINVPSRYDMKNIEMIDFRQRHPEITGKRKLALVYAMSTALRKEIKKNNPDVVVSFIHNNNTLCCLAMLGMKTPLIVSERINTMTCPPNGMWKPLRQIAYARANKIVVQCDIFKHFCHDMYLKKTVTIPNPVLLPDATHEPSLKSNYTVISAGRLTEQKDFLFLIRAFDYVHEQNPNVRLRIIGEGSQRNELEQFVDAQNLGGIVELPGYTTNVYQELADADIYAMTSKDEGFPNSLCEAMAVGLPTVSLFCHEGIGDIVIDGKNGYIVPIRDEKVFAERVIDLLCDVQKRKNCSDEAKKITEQFSMENVYGMWKDVINGAEQK